MDFGTSTDMGMWEMWKFLKRLVDRVMEEIWECFKVLIVAIGGFAVITMVGLMLVGEINIFLGIPVLVVFLLVGNVLMGGEESGECLAVFTYPQCLDSYACSLRCNC